MSAPSTPLLHPSAENCEFCTLLEAVDHPARIAEFGPGVAFLNVDQYYRGRCVLIFRRHLEHFHELSDTEAAALQDAVRRLSQAVWSTVLPQRMNYAVLGNVVAHVHWHLIPRYVSEPHRNGPPWPTPEPIHWPPEAYRSLAADIRSRLAPPNSKRLGVASKTE